jgi:high-affinity nickel-transport protein
MDAESRSPARRCEWLGFTTAEWARVSVLYGGVTLLHVIGWGLFLHYSAHHAALLGLGSAAYLLGIRHAFDADHIAAVDDTVRYLLEKGERPLGVGFFFSLGHSTIVFLLALISVSAAAAVRRNLPALHDLGALLGAGVSGVFLWGIGILNLLVFIRIVKLWRSHRTSLHGHVQVEKLFRQRGLYSRLLGNWMRRIIRSSWQMYPVGMLFGLGFDTASEIALLAMAMGASALATPAAAILSLPILFAAGMCAMDTTDGILMSRAYHWAFVNPWRKMFYNVTLTGLSVAVALLVGTIEWLQVLIGLLRGFRSQGTGYRWDVGSISRLPDGRFLRT